MKPKPESVTQDHQKVTLITDERPMVDMHGNTNDLHVTWDKTHVRGKATLYAPVPALPKTNCELTEAHSDLATRDHLMVTSNDGWEANAWEYK